MIASEFVGLVREKNGLRKEEEEEKGSRKGKGGVTPVSTFSELVFGVSSFSSFFSDMGNVREGERKTQLSFFFVELCSRFSLLEFWALTRYMFSHINFKK